MKARLNFLLSDAWLLRDTGKARYYLDAGRKWSKTNPYLEAISYAVEGGFYYSSNLDKSESAFHKADSLLAPYKSKETYFVRANIWNTCAVIQQRRDDNRAYVDLMLNKALPMAKLSGKKALVGSQYVSVAIAFMDLEQYDRAEQYLDKAIENLKDEAEPVRLSIAYSRATENYIKLGKLDKAKATLDKTIELLKPYPQSEQYAGYYLSEGLYYNELKQFELALVSFNRGIAAANGPNKAYKIMEIKTGMVKAMIGARKYDAAKKLLQELAADEELMSWEESRLEVYEDFAALYAGEGNMKEAYNWMRRSYMLHDSTYENRFKSDINMLEMRYERAENQKTIAELNGKKPESGIVSKK